MTTLLSMELTPAEAKQEVSCEPDPPRYPWGLCIDLDTDTLKKLGIETLPELGTTMTVVARAEVQSASASQSQGDKEQRMNLSLQITDMAVAPAPAARDVAGTLYGG